MYCTHGVIPEKEIEWLALGKKIIAFGVENVYGLMLWDNSCKNWFNFIKTLLNSLVKLFKID